MDTVWDALIALAAVVAPLLLAWWLLGRSARRPAERDLPSRRRDASSDNIKP